MNKLMVGLLIGIFVGGVVGYFVSGIINPNSNFAGQGNFQDFQIDDTTKQEIISFFETTKDIEEINSYCEQNRMNCLSYCREINSEHEICTNLTIPNNRQEFEDRR